VTDYPRWTHPGYALDDRFLRARIADIVAERGIEVIVETGIAAGRSALEFCRIAPRYVGIEINPACLEQTRELLAAEAGEADWQLCQGDSPQMLRDIMPTLPVARTLFFLDAHNFPDSSARWPCRDEIAAIPRGQGVLAFHDFRVPGRDFGVDGYMVDGQVRDFDYDLIRDALTEWSPTHRIEYMQESDPDSSYRGAAFAYPE
jgi:predicted O-methyltransferase YrrM